MRDFSHDEAQMNSKLVDNIQIPTTVVAMLKQYNLGLIVLFAYVTACRLRKGPLHYYYCYYDPKYKVLKALNYTLTE